MPGGDGAKLSQAELGKVRKLCAQVKREPPAIPDIQEMVERENLFVQHYEDEIAPQRQERVDRTQERLERKARIQDELLLEEDER